ncbi:carbohydrate kinase [Treponema parvum]|uniref:Carbohydrate kinase n=1 Tax=Treponema parvum TaxID=138851 RepID=A0A975IFF3_9SPIR|nr:FGGY-family carbohydrate kinase [Treponema parvum]QTQ14279.1 carbohydrate kinase [Treponema parvum]
MKYFLGIDNGGTSTKAAVYDENGRELSVAETSTNLIVPKVGFAERDMEEMWQANCTVIKKSIDKAKIDPSDIACIACSGHGKGVYLWGKNGKPSYPGICSIDNRAWEYPKKWAKDGTEKKVFEISKQHILACQPVSLLAWLKDHEPNVIPQTQYIFSCKDYVRFRLTDQAFNERTDASGANFVNLDTGEYDKELLSLFGIEECYDKLPALKNSADICGRVTKKAAEETGLKEGTAVAGGAFDIDACALALKVFDDKCCCMIAGTWSINEYVSSFPILTGEILMNSFFCIPGKFLVEECSPTSAGNLEWFIQNLMPELKNECKKNQSSIYEFIENSIRSLPSDENCPVFLPFLLGSNVHPLASSCFIGMSKYHTRAHLLKAVFEGIVFSHRYHFEKLQRAAKKTFDLIRLAGGANNSVAWTQIFADNMKIPIEVMDVNETGTLGCAVIGAAATGTYSSLSQAAQNMSRVKRVVTPNKDNYSYYDKKYSLYKKCIDALEPVWEEFGKDA